MLTEPLGPTTVPLAAIAAPLALVPTSTQLRQAMVAGIGPAAAAAMVDEGWRAHPLPTAVAQLIRRAIFQQHRMGRGGSVAGAARTPIFAHLGLGLALQLHLATNRSGVILRQVPTALAPAAD